MKAIALATALAVATHGCAHQQLTNRDVAAAVVGVAALVGLMVLLGAADCKRDNSCPQ